MKRRALLLGLLALAAVALVPGSAGRPLPGAARCPIFPRDNHWNLPVDRLPVHGNSDAIVSSIGPRRERPRRLRLRHLQRRADRHPLPHGVATYQAGCRSPSSTPTSPTAAVTRSRATCRSRAGAGRRRPPRDLGRPRRAAGCTSCSPPTRGRRAALARGLGGDLEPALEPHAAGGLDLGRRRRPADPARPGPARGGAQAHRPRAALHGLALAAGVHLSARHFASTTPIPTCRRWASACGSRPVRHPAGSRASRGWCSRRSSATA